MSWKNEVSEIKKRLRLIQQMGGKDKIKRQHDAGRTTVRERILSLLDKNSFKEMRFDCSNRIKVLNLLLLL